MEGTVRQLVHEHAKFDSRGSNIRGILEEDLEEGESPCEMAWSPSVSVGEEQQTTEVKARPSAVLCAGFNYSDPEISVRELRFFSPGVKDPTSKTGRTRVPRGFSQGRKAVRPEQHQPPIMRGMNVNASARLQNYSNNSREGKPGVETTPGRRRLVRPRSRTSATGACNPNEQINIDGRSRVAEELRNKGNESFKRCEYQQACTHYTGALHALRGIKGTQPASQAIALLYCNRAAAYLALGRPYDALKDCREGKKIEPNYLKCAMRATTCLIRLGRFKEAREEVFRMPSEQAMEKRGEIDHCEGKIRGFLHSLGYDEVNGDLRDLEKNELQTLLAGYKEVQSLVPHSEALKGAIVDAHIRLSDYSTADRILDKILSQNGGNILPWMSWLRAQTCFYKADYKACIGNLNMLEKLMAPLETFDSDLSMALKIFRVPDIEKLKQIIENLELVEATKLQANEAFRGQQYQKATELYSKALRSGYLSPMMAAMLFSNRAAAYSKIGDKVLAMADCCTSKSIIPVYIKACSRLCELLLELNMLGPAEKQILELSEMIPSNGKSFYLNKLNEIRNKMHTAIKPDHYRILGISPKADLSQVKKAYRKLALRLHPDKFLTSSMVFTDLHGVRLCLTQNSDINLRIQECGTWLFKLLGEAYEQLLSIQ